jgi:HAD superfamily hydrolase (TIGR01509 family)
MADKRKPEAPAILFDLDGTLIDSVYQHILAWREALRQLRLDIANAYIHRGVGLSTDLLLHSFERELRRKLPPSQKEKLKQLHTEAFARRTGELRPLRGAKELLRTLARLEVQWAIATTGKREHAAKPLQMLGLTGAENIITGDAVEKAKPDPDLFLVAAKKLGVKIRNCVVVGDSTWDLLAAQRARALGVGMLSGGFGEDELMRAGAYRVYRDPADLLDHLDEIGIRR